MEGDDTYVKRLAGARNPQFWQITYLSSGNAEFWASCLLTPYGCPPSGQYAAAPESTS